MFYNETVKVEVMVRNSVGGRFNEMAVRYVKYCISIYCTTIEAVLATKKERHF